MKHWSLNFCNESLSQDLHAFLANFFLFLHYNQSFPQQKLVLLSCISVLFEVVAISFKDTKFQQIVISVLLDIPKSTSGLELLISFI